MIELISDWRARLAKEMRRKAIHLSGLSVPACLILLDRTATTAAIALALAGALILEWQRLKGRVSLPETREHEKTRVASYIYYIAGCLFAVLFFPPSIAITAVLFLSLGDTASGLAGSIIKHADVRGETGRKGRRRVKPLPVVTVTFVACLLIASLASALSGLAATVTLAGAAAATLADGVALIVGGRSLDDNFTIPVLSGAVMSGVALIL
ncbi:MAG TPA: hypothetical protein PKK11_06530 [Methanothrix sp.]|nr:hypothetical protein [Methanothrix sp.]HPT19026.1 hypothetical protein [Methanothrix sp.]